MKALKLNALLSIIIIIGLFTACSAADPLTEPLYTSGIIDSDSITTVDVYTDDLYAENAYISGDASVGGDLDVGGDVSISGETTFNDQIILDGDGEIWTTYVLDLNWTDVLAHGVPTHVTRGLFDGYSLPVYGADDEELFFEFRVPCMWKGAAWQELATVGDEPGGMAVYQGKLYIPCDSDDTVWVYDGETFSISGTVGDGPVYSYVYNGYLYVTCANDGTVWVYDGVAWALSGIVGFTPYGMVSDGTDLYVACLAGDEIWRLSGGVWSVDPALGAGGVAGAVGTNPLYMAYYGGDVYVGCGGVDDDVWIRTGGVWAKDDDVDGNPQEFVEYGGDLYLNCYTDDSIWVKSGGVWAIATNILTTQGNAPVGLTEFNGSLFSACMDSIWSNHHTIDAYVVPFWNVDSDFTRATGDEPMYLTEYDGKLYCACYANDTIWVYESQTAKFIIHVWLDEAQVGATDAFRIEIAHEAFTPDVDRVPVTSEDTIREIVTGVAAQHQSFGLHIPIDMTGVDGNDSMEIRIRRIASSDEIAGEVVVQHVGITLKCNTLGNSIP